MTDATQLSLFETAREISISEEFSAVNFRGRWEVYGRYNDGQERFSHFATPGETKQFYARRG